MKKYITPPLLKFTGVAILLTAVFRFALGASIKTGLESLVIISACAYAILMFFAGAYFGIKEKRYLPLHDLGFRWNLATFISYFGVSWLWVALGFSQPLEDIGIEHLYIVAIVWGTVLVVHLVIFLLSRRRRAIKGIDKRELFE